jgi:hypothetical protein
MATEEALFASVQQNALQFSTLSANMRVDFNSGEKSFGSKATIKMVKGERLQLSFQPLLGVEAFRAEFTVDSVRIIDRLHKQWTEITYEALQRETGFGFSFNVLEALLTNKLFASTFGGSARSEAVGSTSAVSYGEFKSRRADKSVVFSTKPSEGVALSFTADAGEKLVATKIIDRKRSYAMEWLYDDFSPVENGACQFPRLMTVRVSNDVGSATSDNSKALCGVAEAVISFARISTDVPVKTDFPIPVGYRKLKPQQFFKALKQ